MGHKSCGEGRKRAGRRCSEGGYRQEEAGLMELTLPVLYPEHDMGLLPHYHGKGMIGVGVQQPQRVCSDTEHLQRRSKSEQMRATSVPLGNGGLDLA